MIPSLSESNAYFTPISPAANTSSNMNNVGNNGSSANAKPTLLEMLQRGGQGDTSLPSVKPPSIRDLGMFTSYFILGKPLNAVNH